MKYAYSAAVLAAVAEAFPRNVLDTAYLPDPSKYHRGNEKRQAFGVNVHFDAKSQHVSTTGEHAWVAPKQGDQRGPCPGLNAAANHGYIPHNGVGSITDFIDGTYKAYGMATDLAGFLAVYGAVFDGDLLSWSIGGAPDSALVDLTAGLLGQPTGLEGSHNKYEADYSPTRGDLYQYGNNYLTRLDQFKGLYAYQQDVPEDQSDFSLEVLGAWRAKRFQQSVNENPYFFNNFFSGLEVNPAAYTFAYRFMSNKSAEFPEGRFSKSILRTFFSINGGDNPDNFTYTPGHERIPDNFYKRAVGDEYSIPFFEADVIAMALQHPEFLSFGGNLGTVNSFTPLDIENLTGGIYSAQTLLQPGNLQCFLYEMLISQAPDLLLGLFQNTLAPLQKLKGAAAQFIAGLDCPKLEAINSTEITSQQMRYPGYSKLDQKTGEYN